jgi:hypothetical protein
MKYSITICLLAFVCFGFIIRRHDIKDEEYLKLAKKFENNICNLNLPDGNATFVSKQWLITAAHVAVNIETKLKKGEPHFINFKGQKYKVDKVVLHKEWKRNNRHDIALVHLVDEIEDAQPIDFYSKKDELGKLIYIVGNAGIGNGKEGVEKKTDWKYRAATNRVDEVNDYFIKFVFDSIGTKSNALTEMEGVSGPGDSGGPAFVLEDSKLFLIGVGSTQSTKNTKGVEGVYGVTEQYMRISNYINWINKHLQ